MENNRYNNEKEGAFREQRLILIKWLAGRTPLKQNAFTEKSLNPKLTGVSG